MTLTPKQLEILSEISTEALANYLERRRESENLTDDELREKADENWTEAEKAAEALKNREQN